MDTEYFTYRPDGDLNEVINHSIAKSIIGDCRKKMADFNYSMRMHVWRRIFDELGLEWENRKESNYSDKAKEFKKANPVFVEQAKQQFRDNQPIDCAIEYDSPKQDYITFEDKISGIKVILTDKLSSTKKVMEGDSWGGVSSDFYEGYIEFPKGGAKTKLINATTSHVGLDEILTERNINFSKQDSDWISGFLITQCNEYEYELNGEKRWAFEYAKRTAIDDYIVKFLIFTGKKPSKGLVIAYNSNKG